MSQTHSDQGDKPVVLLAVSKPLFPLGQVVATPGALALLSRHGVEPAELLSRHQSGDWGQLSREDAQANDDAVKFGDRVLSAYELPLAPAGQPGEDAEAGAPARDRAWVITEADRSSTCVLLPSEY